MMMCLFQLCHQVSEVMKMLLGSLLCLFLLLSSLSEPAHSRTLHLGNCSVSVHTQELRKYYSNMRSDVVSLIFKTTKPE